MRLVYVAGPFTAATSWDIEQNVRRAEEVGHFVMRHGGMPVIPHANTRFFHGTATPEFWYEGTLELLRRCDGIIMVDRWQASTGSVREWEEAKRIGQSVFYHARILQNDPLYLDTFVQWCKAALPYSIADIADMGET